MTPSNGAVTRVKPCSLAQPLHVGVGGGEVGGRLRQAAAPLVELLLRDDVLLAQRLPALDRALRQREARRRLAAHRLGLRQLLVDLGRFDDGEQLALGDVAADVLGPALDVAGRARRQRRLLEALQRSRQGERLAALAGANDRRPDVLHRTLADVGLEDLGVRHAADDRPAGADGEQQQDDDDGDARAARDAGALRPASTGAAGAAGGGAGCSAITRRSATRVSARRRRVRRDRRDGARAGRARRRRRPARTAASTPSRTAGRR